MKKKLIHWLGGMTVEESKESDANSWALGKVSMLEGTIAFARELNGKDPQEWCNEMWLYLMAQRKNLYGETK